MIQQPSPILKIAILIILLLLQLKLVVPSYASPEFRTDALSVRESKKFKAFICEVSVAPASFVVDAHQIAISECWLQRTYLPHALAELVFTLKTDGRIVKVDRKLYSDSYKKKLVFDEEDDDGFVLNRFKSKLVDGGFISTMMKQRLKDMCQVRLISAWNGVGYIENHRFTLMRMPASKRVKIRLVDPSSGNLNEKNVTLNFDLSNMKM